MITLDEILSAHSRKVIIGADQIINACNDNHIPLSGISLYLSQSAPASIPAPAFEKKPVFTCPQCGCVMLPTSLQPSHPEYIKGFRTLKKCVGKCSQAPCNYHEYVSDTVEDIIKKWQS